MSNRIEYHSMNSDDRPVVLVDSERYGNSGWFHEETEEYSRSEDHDFSNSSGIKNLDLEVILKRLEDHIKVFKFYRPERIINKYFVPTQDIEEIQRRQEVIKELYESEDLSSQIHGVIVSARKLNAWTPNFIKRSAGNFGKRTEQISHLVNLVESGLEMDVESEVLQGVQSFVQTIAEKTEYKKLKKYIEDCSSELFKDYYAAVKKLTGYFDFQNTTKLQTDQLVDLFAQITGSKNYSKTVGELDADSRRSIYSALQGFKSIFHKLVHTKGLEQLIDAREVETFKIEERLNEIVKRFGNTALLDFKKRYEITKAQKFFLKQTSKLLYQADRIINDGLERCMGSLNVQTNDLEEELAFYYVLATFATDMKRVSPVVMPTILDKKSRYCKIQSGNVPSFVIRALNFPERHKLVPNDVLSNKNHHVFAILGANDNGKTTYERMIGQMQTLAQIGSYVPAKKSRVSIVDGIFTSFNQKDKPGEKEGSFKAGLSYLSFITVPQIRDWDEQRVLTPKEILRQYNLCDHSFITPYSLVLLDEVAVGSDSDATLEAITTILNAAINIGSTLYLSTHYHLIADQITEGRFPKTMNLGAKLRKEEGEMIETYKIIRNIHEPSDGKRLFKKAGYTKEEVNEGCKRLIEAGIV